MTVQGEIVLDTGRALDKTFAGRTPVCVARLIVESGAEVVTLPKGSRKAQRSYDKHLCRECNAVERFFEKLKPFRRVATRCDKLLADVMGLAKLAAIAIWLKELNRHHAMVRRDRAISMRRTLPPDR